MPDTLFSLAEQIRRCTACPLWKGRTLAVPGEGPKDAKLMFIGEAPGEQEDRQGLPFVGRSGEFLTKMLGEIGIDRKDVFITSSAKCRPPKNRAPTVKECTTCKNLWLDKQIAILNPKLIVLLGGVAMRTCLGEKNVKSFHGKIVEKDGRKYFVTYHPAASLRFPALREEMKKDFVKLKGIIKKF